LLHGIVVDVDEDKEEVRVLIDGLVVLVKVVAALVYVVVHAVVIGGVVEIVEVEVVEVTDNEEGLRRENDDDLVNLDT